MLEDPTSLRLSMLKCSIVKFTDGFLSVPVFLVDAFNLLSNGIKREGVFRKSGNAQRVKMIKYPFFGEFGLPEGTNIYDLCDLIKQFFREIEEPLFTDGLEPQFLKYYAMSREDIRIRYILELCHVLPPRHRETLSFLMRHLKRVASFSEFNKMSQHSLAVVFVPSVFRSQPVKSSFVGVNPEMDVQMQKRETKLKADLLEILIQHAEEICVLSEYEKVMSPDMYDKLLPEDRTSYREMMESLTKQGTGKRLVKSNAEGHVKDRNGTTPVSSKNRPSIKKRKSTIGAGEKIETFQNKLDDAFKVSADRPQSDDVVVVAENSEKKRRSNYSATMKKMSSMAKREIDKNLFYDSQIKTRTGSMDLMMADVTNNVDQKLSINNDDTDTSLLEPVSTVDDDGVYPEVFVEHDKHQPTVGTNDDVIPNAQEPTPSVFEETVPQADDVIVVPYMEPIPVVIIEETKTPRSDDVIENANTVDDVFAHATPIDALCAVEAPKTFPEIKGRQSVSVTSVESVIGCLATATKKPDSVLASMQIPRSQSESSTIGHRQMTAASRVVKHRRRVHTSPRKKLRRNVANVCEKPFRINSKNCCYKQPEMLKTLLTSVVKSPASNVGVLVERVLEVSPSVEMDFKNSDARKEAILQQTDNTESKIIDAPRPAQIPLPTNGSSVVPQDYCNSPAALHRPSVAFIVNQRRGIVRHNLSKFEEIAKTGQNTVFVKSPTKGGGAKLGQRTDGENL